MSYQSLIHQNLMRQTLCVKCLIHSDCVCMLQMRMCQTEGQQGTVQSQSAVESCSLQVIVTHPSPCATPALSPQTPSGSATATTVWIRALTHIQTQSLNAFSNE